MADQVISEISSDSEILQFRACGWKVTSQPENDLNLALELNKMKPRDKRSDSTEFQWSGCKGITHTPRQRGLCFCRVTGDLPAFSTFRVQPCRSARRPLQRFGLGETRALSPTSCSSKPTWDWCPEATLKGTESRKRGDPAVEPLQPLQ